MKTKSVGGEIWGWSNRQSRGGRASPRAGKARPGAGSTRSAISFGSLDMLPRKLASSSTVFCTFCTNVSSSRSHPGLWPIANIVTNIIRRTQPAYGVPPSAILLSSEERPAPMIQLIAIEDKRVDNFLPFMRRKWYMYQGGK